MSATLGTALTDRVRADFAEAAQAAGVHDWERSIGGRPVRLRFAGPALVDRFEAALGHHARSDPADAAVSTVSLWDGASTGAHLGIPTPAGVMGGGLAMRHEYHDGRIELQWIHDTVTVIDADAAAAWWYAADAERLSWFEAAGPLRYWLAAWSHRHGYVFTHAAAVGDDAGAVLLAGMSGSGKSTASLVCLGSGLRFLGDDYVLVQPGAMPCVHNVYGTAKVVPGGEWRLPALRAEPVAGDSAPDRKLVVPVATQFPQALIASLPLRAVLSCVITGGTTRAIEISPRDALLGVAPSTLMQLPKAIAASALARLRDVVTRLPAFRLELGDDSAAVPDVLARLLGTLAAP